MGIDDGNDINGRYSTGDPVYPGTAPAYEDFLRKATVIIVFGSARSQFHLNWELKTIKQIRMEQDSWQQ